MIINKKSILLLTLFANLIAFDAFSQNCQGPESCPPGDDCGYNTYYQDFDGDGKGNPNVSIQCVNNPSGYVLNNQDCDDNDPNVWNSCCTERTWYRDSDNDGIGNSSITTRSCTRPSGYVGSGGDCNDNNNSIQGPKTWYVDNDGDGQGADMSSDYHQGLPPSEIGTPTKSACSKPSGYVSNNDDCNDLNANIQQTTWGRDFDGDGFGTSSDTYIGCNLQPGYVANTSDCNDSNGNIHPNTIWYKDSDNDGHSSGQTVTRCTRLNGYKLASELISLNGDCDDSDASVNITYTWYLDNDQDGYGSNSNTTTNCRQPAGYVSNSADCNDNNAEIHPTTIWYEDADNDGYGNPNGLTLQRCDDPSVPDTNWVTNGDDCDDSDGVPPPRWYLDTDGDGYAGNNSVRQCTQPANGYAESLDCNDNNAPHINLANWWYIDNDGDGLGADMDSERNQNFPPSEFPDPVYACSPPEANWVSNNSDCYDPPIGSGGTGNEVLTLYLDNDGDGFGDPNETMLACDPYDNYIIIGGDCNDDPALGGASIHPNTSWYQDIDQDGFTSGISATGCSRPDNTYYLESELPNAINLIDCNDSDPDINPNTKWYQDSDSDAFGNPAEFLTQCEQPDGYVRNNTDECPLHWGSNQGCPSLGLNFIKTYATRIAGVAYETVDQYSKEEASLTTTYFDGLGNKLQIVARQVSPLGFDAITPFSYDVNGRPDKEYLPYVSGATTGDFQEEALLNNYELSDHYLWYQNATGIANDTRPFTEINYDGSPLYRVLSQVPVGEEWEYHPVTYKYNVNAADEVVMWKFNSILTEDIAYYTVGELSKSKTTDEDLKSTIEFTNKLGHTILKLSQVDTDWASTYYIYDDFGRLRLVIPPEAVKRLTSEFFAAGSDRQAFLDIWAFQYEYDARGRMIEKKVPGAERIKMVYDQWDRLVLTQDGNQLSEDQWLFTKYDGLNRPVINGIVNDYPELIDDVTSSSERFEVFNGVGAIDSTGYTDNTFPKDADISNYLTVTYYDNHDFLAHSDLQISGYQRPADFEGVNVDIYHLLPENEQAVIGLVTGTKTKVLGSAEFIETVTFYDNRYRVIQSVTENHLGGVDVISNQYDFLGNIRRVKSTHDNGSTTTGILMEYQYDHANRLITCHHTIANGDRIELYTNEYNELGELVRKNLHYSSSDAGYKQQLDYEYNIRGWLRSINESTFSGIPEGLEPPDLFNMELIYNTQLPD